MLLQNSHITQCALYVFFQSSDDEDSNEPGIQIN